MNKKLMIPMFAILFLGSVFAVGYVVNSFVIQSDVYEPLQVSYAVVGDADNWGWSKLCRLYWEDILQ